MPESGRLQIESTDLPEAMAEQLSLEDATRSEEAQMARERAENGNARPHVPRGVEKRIGKLVRQNKELEAELAKYRQAQNGNGAQHPSQRVEYQQPASNGTAPHAEEQRQESLPQEVETPAAEDPKISALRDRYPDWDSTMSRAQNEGMRISDEAAEVLHETANAGHIAYMLASNDQFRNEFNKLPPKQQAAEIRKIDGHISAMESGHIPFAERAKATLSKQEISEMLSAAESNRPGERLVLSLAKEINSLPNGPQVAKFVITNPELSRQLAGLSQSAASLALGRISAGLEARSRPGAAVSTAPAPITPLRGHSVKPQIDLNDPELDYQSYKATREKMEKSRYRDSETSYSESGRVNKW